MRYVVVIEKTETGYSAYVPDLPGRISVGGTREEMERNIREAIELYLDELREQGVPIPAPTTDTEYHCGVAVRLLATPVTTIFV